MAEFNEKSRPKSKEVKEKRNTYKNVNALNKG